MSDKLDEKAMSVDWEDLHSRLARAMRGADPGNSTSSKPELVQSAPAAVPSEDEIADLIDEHIPTFYGHREAARAVLALFAPILADASTTNSQGWRQMALDEHQKRLAAEGAFAKIVSECQIVCDSYAAENQRLHDRALAAEAALAAERERCARVAERFMAAGKVVDGQLYAGPNTPRAIAAAIRAQE